MKNLLELFENVIDVMYQLGIDPRDILDELPEAEEQAAAIRVVGAHQPNYPLAENISRFVLLPSDEADEADEADEDSYNEIDLSGDKELICWLTLDGHPTDLSPYAPYSCFN